MTNSHIKEQTATSEDKRKEIRKKYIRNLNLSVAVGFFDAYGGFTAASYSSIRREDRSSR